MLALASFAEHVYLAPPGSVYLAGLRAEVPFVRDALARLKIEAYVAPAPRRRGERPPAPRSPSLGPACRPRPGLHTTSVHLPSSVVGKS